MLKAWKFVLLAESYETEHFRNEELQSKLTLEFQCKKFKVKFVGENLTSNVGNICKTHQQIYETLIHS